MPRQFTGDRLVIASHNRGKIPEIATLLRGRVPRLTSAADHGIAEPEETGMSFVANAELKALNSALRSGLPALADDSGLAVDALDGAPGIYSARWAVDEAGRRDFSYAMRKVEERIGGDPRRTARFVAALSLAWPDGHVETVEGRVEGTLTFPPRGDRGFGYDPIFVPLGHDITFGEMEPEEKHQISHRARAFEQLLARCFAGT